MGLRLPYIWTEGSSPLQEDYDLKESQPGTCQGLAGPGNSISKCDPVSESIHSPIRD